MLVPQVTRTHNLPLGQFHYSPESDCYQLRAGHRGRPFSLHSASPRIFCPPWSVVEAAEDTGDAEAMPLLVPEQAPPSITTGTDCTAFCNKIVTTLVSKLQN